MFGKGLNNIMKKEIVRVYSIVLFIIIAVSSVTYAEESGDMLNNFYILHGDRNNPRISITIDDGYELEYYWKCAELCRLYHVGMTFFPIGLVLKESDRENWQAVLDAGCEIGSHSNAHNHLDIGGPANTILRLGRFQEKLDQTLGYHYEIRWMRPPFGAVAKDKKNTSITQNAIRRYGYEHIVLWDVSETNPEEVLNDVQNGSILLFHARKKDYRCIESILPKLLEAGYQIVTLSEMFGFGPPEVSESLYIYDKKNYQ